MTMSKMDDSRGDSHLNNSLSQGPIINKTPQKANPPSNKPLTSFGIEDILGVASPTKPTSKDVVTKKHLENRHDDPHHLPNKINRSTSPDLPEITPISKPYPKHLYNTNNDEIDDNALSNGKRRMNNTLHIFNSLAKAPRNGKIAADDFRTATVAAAAAVASINQNNFFSSPFGCFPKTLLQGFIPAFNLNPNHLTPQHPQHPHHPHPQHPHHIIPHTDSQHHHQQQQHQHHHNPHHHHHHQQQQQQQQQQLHRQQQHSPSFLQGPVNLTLGNHNISGNHGNNSNGSNVKIVRPWDDNSGSCLDASSPSPSSSKTPPTTHTATTTTITTTTMASDDSYDEDDDEEISVDDEDPPCPPPGKRVKAANGDSVSPLDALMAMTSKTFAGLDNKGSGDPKRKDQAVMFGKHQPPKKRRKSRTAFTNQQIYELEKRFLYQKYLTPADRDEIAINLGLTNAQVITWFQNRRAKLKRDLEELKSDVTASKKLPIPRNMSGSVTEIELRRIQERTLRESFCNGGLQSPSSCSMASLSDDHDSTTPIHAATTPIRDVATPIRSPPITDSERIHVDVVGSDPSDVEFSKNSERRIEGNPSLRNASEDCVDNINNDMNENSNASLSPRESRENGGIVSSECGSRCDVDNQKNIGCFPMEVSPGVV